jgi:hypothetical protein
MSTRAIREALRELSALKGMTQVQAYAEVEAIEKAAKALDDWRWSTHRSDDLHNRREDAMDLMERIAEEAK